MKKRYDSIDALRLLCSLFVVFLHITFPHPINRLIEPVTRCAVPIFFMISGFFSLGATSDKVAKHIFSTVKIFCVAVIIFFMKNMIICVLNGNSILAYISSIFSVHRIIESVIFNTCALGDIHWFLLALIYTEVVFYVFVRHNKDQWIWAFIVPGLIGYHVLGKYSVALLGTQFPFHYARNFLFDGIPYFALGHYIAYRTKNSFKINNGAILCMLIGGYVVSLAEKLLLIKNGVYIYAHHYISCNIMIVALFLLAVNNFSWGGVLAGYGRKYSLLIYLVHMYVANFLAMYSAYINEYFMPILVYALSVLTATVLDNFINIVKKSSQKSSTVTPAGD